MRKQRIFILVSIVFGFLITFQNRRFDWYFAADEYMVGEVGTAGFTAMLVYGLLYWFWLRKKK